MWKVKSVKKLRFELDVTTQCFPQDCMAQRALPWDSLVPAVVQWRGVTVDATTAEPNDYNSSDRTYGVEHNNENCAKFQDGLAVDYACGPLLAITPTAYVCSKSRCELFVSDTNPAIACFHSFGLERVQVRLFVFWRTGLFIPHFPLIASRADPSLNRQLAFTLSSYSW